MTREIWAWNFIQISAYRFIAASSSLLLLFKFFSSLDISFGADVILLIFDLILSSVGTFQSIDVDLLGFALDSNQIAVLAPYR